MTPLTCSATQVGPASDDAFDEEKAKKKKELDFQNMQNLITDLDYKNELLDFDFEDDQQRLANKEAYIAFDGEL